MRHLLFRHRLRDCGRSERGCSGRSSYAAEPRRPDELATVDLDFSIFVISGLPKDFFGGRLVRLLIIMVCGRSGAPRNADATVPVLFGLAIGTLGY